MHLKLSSMMAILFLHASCSDGSRVPDITHEHDGGFSLPSEHREMFKLRYQRDFELHDVNITSKEIANKQFKKYYEESLSVFGEPRKGVTKVWYSSGYYYARLNGQSWYIFAKHGESEIYDGGYTP